MLSMCAARRDVERLKDEGAPANVIAVAERVIKHASEGAPPPPGARDVLFAYALRRGQQNRWGK